MPGNGRAARAVAAAVEVELEQDLRVVLADLRAGDEERLARRRSASPRRAARSTSAGGSSSRSRRRSATRRVGESTTTFPISLELCEPYANRPGHGDVRLGVVPLAQVLPDAPTRLLPELALEQVEELRAAHLVASSGAEDRADQPADRDDVVPRPRSDREPCLAVLAR